MAASAVDKLMGPAPAGTPRTALRIACAGAVKLGTAGPAVSSRMTSLFEDIALAMEAAAPAHIQLLTGLADGGDQCAAGVFMSVRDARVEREHVAVLPFDLATYRDRSPISNKQEFDTLIERSSLVIELDGRWVPDDDPRGVSFAKHCRARAYRAQARVMLQRADLLLAVFDPEAERRPGGTAETVRTAVELNLPVLVVAIGAAVAEPTLHLLRTLADFDSLGPWEATSAAVEPSCQRSVITSLVEVARPAALGPIPAPSPLERLWTGFEARFHAGQANGTPAKVEGAPEKNSPFYDLREHARKLNARFNGRYRGGFLMNFAFAAIATTLAASSLGLIAWGNEHGRGTALLMCLLILAVAKLALVVTIFMLTDRARRHHWNERAVDARYLAENLRLLFWLPALGLLRAPRCAGQHHADAGSKLHTTDALLQAAVRAAPPSTGLLLQEKGFTKEPRHATIDVRSAVSALIERWILGQMDYHLRNARRMGRMFDGLSHLTQRLNKIVIGCVAADIVTMIAVGFWGVESGALEVIEILLVVIAAAFPAAVAALNGTREQGEVRRLSERSRQLAASLKSIGDAAMVLLTRIEAAAQSGRDPGGWTLESLAIAEQCSKLVAEDVAEWSVLYGKQIAEP